MQYLQTYISLNGGYLTHPNATTTCEYCPYRTTDEFLESRNIFYSNHWKNLAIFCGFTAFNVSVRRTLCGCLTDVWGRLSPSIF